MAEHRQTLSEWLQFLLEAGIPASQAANYAVSFVENRIEKEMLLDLDKDYLKDLGVNVLGDVIAILKHAKKVASQLNKRSDIQMVRTADGIKKSTPATRLVDHYLKGSDSNPPSPKVPETAEYEEDDVDMILQATTHKKASVPKKSKLRSDRVASTPRGRVPPSTRSAPSPAKRRRVASPIVTDKLVEEVPVQKKRRVLPEHEGGYKITMPSGSAPRTARLIAQGKLSNTPRLSPGSKGVFSRLGSTPSSSATRKAPHSELTVTKAQIIQAQSKKADSKIAFTVTGLGNVDIQDVSHSIKTSETLDKGVFRRLGGSSTPPIRRTIKRPATSTQPDKPIVLDATPYIGILKDGGKHAKSKEKLKQAVSARDRSGFAVSRITTENVKQRLGQSKASPTLRTISTRPSVTSVKRRLGGPSDSTVSSSTDRSASAIRVSTKAQVTFPSSRRASKAAPATVVNHAADVFSRLGSR